MDYEFIRDVIPMFAQAALLTLRLAFIGILFSIVAGFLCAFVRYEKIPVLKVVARVYIELSRNTPLLVQIFFLYFAFKSKKDKISPNSNITIKITSTSVIITDWRISSTLPEITSLVVPTSITQVTSPSSAITGTRT